AAIASCPLGARASAFAYFGLPGEPAVGPPAFMHRGSAMEIPVAPLSHHWLDSTHITYGTFTAGVIRGGIKVEASAFNGHEPDARRWNIERPRFDSWAARLTVNPRPWLSAQVSAAEGREPGRVPARGARRQGRALPLLRSLPRPRVPHRLRAGRLSLRAAPAGAGRPRRGGLGRDRAPARVPGQRVRPPASLLLALRQRAPALSALRRSPPPGRARARAPR